MEQALAHLSPTTLAALIVANLLAASKIAGPLAPIWPRLPQRWSVTIPALVAMLPLVANFFVDVQTWIDFWVSVANTLGLVLPGLLPKDRDGAGGDQTPAGHTTPMFPPPSDDEPPAAAMLAFACGLVALLLVGCAATPHAPCDEHKVGAIALECNGLVEQCKASGDDCEAIKADCNERIEEACP